RGFLDGRSCHNRIGSSRQLNDDGRALIDLAFDQQAAAMCFDDARDKIQSQAGSSDASAVLSSEIGGADARPLVRRDAAAAVGDRDADHGAVFLDADRNRSIRRGILDAVRYDVLEYVAEQHRISLDE